MVAPQHDHLPRTGYLHGQDEQQHLDGEVATVHVVPQEHVLGCVAVAAHVLLQQLQEVVELPVDVPHDGHRVVHQHQVRLGLWVIVQVLKM